MRNFVVLAGLIFICFSDDVTFADEAEKPITVTFTTNLYGNILVHPGPSWLSEITDHSKALELSEYNRQQHGNQFMIEMVPKGEQFTNWNSFHGIWAIKDQNFSDKSLNYGTIQVYVNACNDLVIDDIKTSKKGYLSLIFCGSYKHNSGIGQIAILRVLSSNGTHVKIYHEWKGSAFKHANSASWPVSERQVNQIRDSLEEKVEFFGLNELDKIQE